MPTTAKPTFPPLFPAGLTEISLGHLAGIFVGPGFDTPLRHRLTSQLRLFITMLSALGARGDLWINGSYATKKPEPGDVDVVLSMPLVTVSAMSDENLERLRFLTDQGSRAYVRARWQVDFYVFESSDLASRNYYFELFSRNPDQSSRKGIPFIRI